LLSWHSLLLVESTRSQYLRVEIASLGTTVGHNSHVFCQGRWQTDGFGACQIIEVPLASNAFADELKRRSEFAGVVSNGAGDRVGAERSIASKRSEKVNELFQAHSVASFILRGRDVVYDGLVECTKNFRRFLGPGFCDFPRQHSRKSRSHGGHCFFGSGSSCVHKLIDLLGPQVRIAKAAGIGGNHNAATTGRSWRLQRFLQGLPDLADEVAFAPEITLWASSTSIDPDHKITFHRVEREVACNAAVDQSSTFETTWRT
jgi:hypothetical protein